jgi:hypothetical protein
LREQAPRGAAASRRPSGINLTMGLLSGVTELFPSSQFIPSSDEISTIELSRRNEH